MAARRAGRRVDLVAEEQPDLIERGAAVDLPTLPRAEADPDVEAGRLLAVRPGVATASGSSGLRETPPSRE